MRVVTWKPISSQTCEAGDDPFIRKHLNLTELHGEREFLRHAFLADVDGDGEFEIITRTLNANRARAIRISDGSTVWVSPDIAPPPEQSTQISDMAIGDLDEDGRPEVVLASYDGDVLCIDGTDGSLIWHRRLPFLINNSHLSIRRITDAPGRNIALTVGHTDIRTGESRPRVNYVPNPSLLVLDCDGNDVAFVENYAEHNSSGHDTWVYDIDGDGLCEVACCGDAEIIWFNGKGERLFTMPSEGQGKHPDDLLVYKWFPELPGNQIIYLNGERGLRMYSGEGRPLRDIDLSDSSSHLQQIMIYPTERAPRTVGVNIRARDSKLLFLDEHWEPEWGLQLDVDVMFPSHVDWNGDGEDEIITGSFGLGDDNPGAPHVCSFQIMDTECRPLYRRQWEGMSLCKPLDMADIDGDGRPEILVSVGDKDGPEGRWSLPEGGEQHLYIIGAPEGK